jgi:hypothetical protein
MNYRKTVGCLLILFSLLENVSAEPLTRLIICKTDQENQKFICLADAADEVAPHINEYIYIVGYGSARRIPCSGRDFAIAFRRQLLDTLIGRELPVNESQVILIDGGYREDSLIVIYAGGAGEQPPSMAQWPPKCP